MLTLISNGHATRSELAARYEISGRTVQRYIDELIEAGLPIDAVTGKGGGYFISEGYRISGALLTREDLDRIRSGLDALSSTFPEGTADEIMGKLTCVAEEKSISALTPRFYVDSDSWNSSGSVPPKLIAISAAVDSCQTVKIEYTDRKGTCTKRRLDPYTIALKEGVWYVYGWCHVHRDFRLFRLARMRSVELTEVRFIRREGGDVRSALSVSLGAPVDIELEVNDSALAKAEEWLGEENLTIEDGKYVFRAKINDSYELANKILSMGLNAKVLAPQSLIERVKTTAWKITNEYSAEKSEY